MSAFLSERSRASAPARSQRTFGRRSQQDGSSALRPAIVTSSIMGATLTSLSSGRLRPPSGLQLRSASRVMNCAMRLRGPPMRLTAIQAVSSRIPRPIPEPLGRAEENTGWRVQLSPWSRLTSTKSSSAASAMTTSAPAGVGPDRSVGKEPARLHRRVVAGRHAGRARRLPDAPLVERGGLEQDRLLPLRHPAREQRDEFAGPGPTEGAEPVVDFRIAGGDGVCDAGPAAPVVVGKGVADGRQTFPEMILAARELRVQPPIGAARQDRPEQMAIRDRRERLDPLDPRRHRPGDGRGLRQASPRQAREDGEAADQCGEPKRTDHDVFGRSRRSRNARRRATDADRPCRGCATHAVHRIGAAVRRTGGSLAWRRANPTPRPCAGVIRLRLCRRSGFPISALRAGGLACRAQS